MLLVYGIVCLDSSMLLLDFVHLEPGPSTRGFARADLLMFVYGMS